MRRLKYLIINYRRLFKVNAIIKKIVNEINEEMLEKELRRIKFAMF